MRDHGDRRAFAFWLCGGLWLAAAGCQPVAAIAPNEGPGGTGQVEAWDESNLDAAVRNLNRHSELANLATFRDPKLREQMLARMEDWVADGQPAIGWAPWPIAALMQDLEVRLTQWIQAQDLPPWRPDPLLDTLPAAVRNLPAAGPLEALHFSPLDVQQLIEAVWLRDTGHRVCGQEDDPLRRVAALCEWTVRNVQLVEPAGEEPLLRFPWQTLLLSQGSVRDRMWLLALLARQQGLDVVLLELAASQDRPGGPWAAALVHEGELYLFDLRLGLPLRLPDGQVATLSQVQADPTLLRHWDVVSPAQAPEDPAPLAYPLAADDLPRLGVFLEASPLYVRRAAAALGSRLAGREGLVLRANAAGLAEQLQNQGVPAPAVWPYPWEVLRAQTSLTAAQRQQLWRELLYCVAISRTWQGRMLYLNGRIGGTEGAGVYYHQARPSDQVLQAQRTHHAVVNEARPLTRQLATLWQGILAHELGSYSAAADYFEHRLLADPVPSPWAELARFNLARAREELGAAQLRTAARAQDRAQESLRLADQLDRQADQAAAAGNKLEERRWRDDARAIRQEGASAGREAAAAQRAARAEFLAAIAHFEQPAVQRHGNLLRAQAIREHLPDEPPPDPAPDAPPAQDVLPQGESPADPPPADVPPGGLPAQQDAPGGSS